MMALGEKGRRSEWTSASANVFTSERWHVAREGILNEAADPLSPEDRPQMWNRQWDSDAYAFAVRRCCSVHGHRPCPFSVARRLRAHRATIFPTAAFARLSQRRGGIDRRNRCFDSRFPSICGIGTHPAALCRLSGARLHGTPSGGFSPVSAVGALRPDSLPIRPHGLGVLGRMPGRLRSIRKTRNESACTAAE